MARYEDVLSADENLGHVNYFLFGSQMLARG